MLFDVRIACRPGMTLHGSRKGGHKGPPLQLTIARFSSCPFQAVFVEVRVRQAGPEFII